MKRYLRRGIPSLFTDVKALYINEGKVSSSCLCVRVTVILFLFLPICRWCHCQVAIIEKVFEGFLESLRASSTFPESSDWEAPTVVVVSERARDSVRRSHLSAD